MSSKYGSLSVPAAHRSQALDALNSIMSTNATDKRYEQQNIKDDRRFQLRLARQNRQDALQAARTSLVDKQYNDSIAHRDKLEAKAEADKNNLLNSELVALKSATDIVDPYTSKDVEDKTNVISTDYDVEALNKNASSIPVVDAWKKETINPTDLALITQVEDINKRTDIDNLDKEALIRDLIPKSDKDNADGLLMKLGKYIATPGNAIRGAIEGLSGDIQNALSSDGAIDLRKDIRDGIKEREEALTIKEPYSAILEKIRKIKETKTKNKLGKDKYDQQILAQKEALNRYKTKKTYGTKKQSSLMDKDKFVEKLNAKIQKDIDKIPKTLSVRDRKVRELAIRKSRYKELSNYTGLTAKQAERAIKREDKQFDSQLEAAKQKSVKQYEYELKAVNKKLENDPENKSLKAKKIRAEIKYKNAATEYKIAQKAAL